MTGIRGNERTHPAKRDAVLARVIGALFILTMLMGMVDAYAAAPILRGPLEQIHLARGLVLTGGVMRLLMSIGVVGIAMAFLPIVRPYNETIAVSYLGFRLAECVLLALGVGGHVFLLGLSEDFAEAGAGAAPLFHTLARSALELTDITYQIAMTLLGLIATMHCTVLLRARLIPPAIAGLGIVGYALVLASALLAIVGAIDTTAAPGALLYVPGGLFELVVLPGWLFWKGFSKP
jgi:hypothetical protein